MRIILFLLTAGFIFCNIYILHHPIHPIYMSYLISGFLGFGAGLTGYFAITIR